MVGARSRVLFVLAAALLWSPVIEATDGFECEEFREHLDGVRPSIDRREVREELPPPEIVRVEEHVIERKSGGCGGRDSCDGRIPVHRGPG